ncbi:hypothetical protein ACQRC6_01115 [Peptoniphilus sp. SGI.035]
MEEKRKLIVSNREEIVRKTDTNPSDYFLWPKWEVRQVIYFAQRGGEK